METLKIIEEKRNDLFKRKEIKLTMDSEVTPSYEDVLKLVSKI